MNTEKNFDQSVNAVEKENRSFNILLAFIFLLALAFAILSPMPKEHENDGDYPKKFLMYSETSHTLEEFTAFD